MLTRRGFLGSLLAAPIIIRTPGLLMPVRPVAPPLDLSDLTDFLTRALLEQDRLRAAQLASWALTFNQNRIAPDPMWRSSLA